MGNLAIAATIVIGVTIVVPCGAEAADGLRHSLYGFTATASEHERLLESSFDANLQANDLRAWLKQMSSEPNDVNSPHDKANADFVLRKFREWGWEAHLERFDVLYPTLKSHALELLTPIPFVAGLAEPAIPEDTTSAKTADAIRPYAIYGADGDVTAGLVYVNFGMQEDYEELARQGISVTGQIVIVRYGGGFRGVKPLLAHQHGAVGCIIYSDPAEDGYATGDPYPKGGARGAKGVQRGQVANVMIYPGDPLTPGVGAIPGAKRLTLSDAKTIQKIPVLPVSYADALPFLKALEGPVAPKGWRGALPITYHVGPGPAKVHLAVASNWTTKPIYDVIATIRGGEYPDQWVIRGNHRDAWVFGAWDPLAAHTAMLAEAKAIGALARKGWRPKRTLVYASLGW